ncbi:MAG: hypothetical protein Tsb0020_49480 [Haliangiales bacterium]
MPYRDLRISEMVSLTSTWVDPEHADNAALRANPVTAALLPHLGATHAELVAFQRDSETDRLGEISRQQRDIDARADALWRAIRASLDTHLYLATDPDSLARWQRLDELVFSDGMAIINYSYREAAGYGELLAARLDDDARAALTEIPTAYGSLLDVVSEWLTLAQQIGELEHERDKTPDHRVTVGRLRNRWIRAVITLRQLIRTVELDDQLLADAMLRIDRAVRTAEIRRARSGGSPDGDPDGAPVLDDDDPIGEGEPIPGDDALLDGDQPGFDGAPIGDDEPLPDDSAPTGDDAPVIGDGGEPLLADGDPASGATGQRSDATQPETGDGSAVSGPSQTQPAASDIAAPRPAPARPVQRA